MLERAAFVSALAVVMGSLFVMTDTLALGDPVPRRIDAAVIGDPASHVPAVNAVERVAENSIHLERSPRSARPAGVASAGGVRRPRSDATHAAPLRRERVGRVRRARPRAGRVHGRADPRRRHAPARAVGSERSRHLLPRPGLDDHRLSHGVPGACERGRPAAPAVGVVRGRVRAGRGARADARRRADLRPAALPVLESWGILALQIVAVSSFASTMVVLVGRWAILPTWLFFVVLGNTSSGGAVSPPLLPRPFALVSEWLPSGAAVTSLRDAVYFQPYQHAQPIAVLATWAAASFAAMLVASHRRRASPGLA